MVFIKKKSNVKTSVFCRIRENRYIVRAKEDVYTLWNTLWYILFRYIHFPFLCHFRGAFLMRKFNCAHENEWMLGNEKYCRTVRNHVLLPILRPMFPPPRNQKIFPIKSLYISYINKVFFFIIFSFSLVWSPFEIQLSFSCRHTPLLLLLLYFQFRISSFGK